MWRLQSVAVHRLDDIWTAPETFANANGIVAGLSQHMTRLGEYREVLFWLLLLGSWQFLASPGAKSAVVGAGEALMFLLFAFRNLGRLTRLGLGYASWMPTSRAKWALAAASGLIAGIVIFGIGSASGQGMTMSSNWRLVLLQVTLGPVREVGTRGGKRAHCRHCNIRDRVSERTGHDHEQQLETGAPAGHPRTCARRGCFSRLDRKST